MVYGMNKMIEKMLRFVLKVCKHFLPEYDYSKMGMMGTHVKIAPGSFLNEKNLYLEDYTMLQEGIRLISNEGRLIVKKYSVVASNCIFIPGTHRLKVGVPFYLAAKYHIGDEDKQIVIEEDCWVGAGCIVLPGVKIGRGSVVGAGSVVTKDVLPYSVVAGVPAKIIAVKFREEDVLLHEQVLYSADERMTQEQIHELFIENYKGFPVIGNACLKDDELLSLQLYMQKEGIAAYKDFHMECCK